MSDNTSSAKTTAKTSQKRFNPKTPLDGEKVVAERFRTKKCKNYVRTGECPYESRCMFAHGKHELRSAEQNLEDGLVTEKAIHRFKKAELKTREQTHVEPAARTAPDQAPNNASSGSPPRVSYIEKLVLDGDSTGSHHFSSKHSPKNEPLISAASFTTSTYDELEISNRAISESGDTYHYNPYGWRAVEPTS